MAVGNAVVDPGVIVQLGGKERRLIFKTWSWMQLEKLQQRSLLGRPISFNSLNDVINFTWAALIPTEKGLDGFISATGEPTARALSGIQQVAEWIDTNDAVGLVPKILEAIKESQPEAEEKN